jgi:hypothetical protein
VHNRTGGDTRGFQGINNKTVNAHGARRTTKDKDAGPRAVRVRGRGLYQRAPEWIAGDFKASPAGKVLFRFRPGDAQKSGSWRKAHVGGPGDDILFEQENAKAQGDSGPNGSVRRETAQTYDGGRLLPPQKPPRLEIAPD